MINLHLIEEQPRWRIAVVHWFAKAMGVCIHVEGIPFGSSRTRRMGQRESGEAGALGQTHE